MKGGLRPIRLGWPGINQLDACRSEVANVAGHDGETVLQGRRGNEQVRRGDVLPGPARPRGELSPSDGGFEADW